MNEHYPFTNPPLPYAYDAMEPFIDTKTMELHHDRHLQTYVDNLNKALEKYPGYQHLSLQELIAYADYFPQDIRTTVKNNAGGVYNHLFYFWNLSNSNEKEPIGLLGEKINEAYNSFVDFQKEFTNAALSVFGSGYAWLVVNQDGAPGIMTTPNQDAPLAMGVCPVLNFDVWEHAYYLKHYNARADYIKDWFQVVNWNQANQNLLDCGFQ